MAMKECPNCGAQARAEWVLCPSCRMNMLEAAVVLGRDHYVAPGDEAAAAPPDLTAYELPRRSPVVTAARSPPPAGVGAAAIFGRSTIQAPSILWFGGGLYFVSLNCPAATGFGRNLMFSAGLPGLAIVIVGTVLLGATIFRRPIVAMIAAGVGIAVIGISWALLAISPYDAGWGWLVLGAGGVASLYSAGKWIDAVVAERTASRR